MGRCKGNLKPNKALYLKFNGSFSGPPCIRSAQKLNRKKVLYININKIINNYFVEPRLIWTKNLELF
jgi:hypothetical protein